MAAQQVYIHVTDLHAKNMVNGGGITAKFCKTTQKREVEILIICLSDLAATRLEKILEGRTEPYTEMEESQMVARKHW